MRACGHRYGTDLLWIEAALRRVAAHDPYGALTVFPGRAPYRQPFRARRAVNEVHALASNCREKFVPPLDEADIAAAFVGAAGDENHACAVRIRRRIEPLYVRFAMCRRVKPRSPRLVRHCPDLVRLCIGHLAFRPYLDALAGASNNRSGHCTNQCRCQKSDAHELSPSLSHGKNVNYTIFHTPCAVDSLAFSFRGVDALADILIYFTFVAPVVKLAYTPDSGSGAARCVGSNPTGCTKAGPFVYRLGHLVLIQARGVRLS